MSHRLTAWRSLSLRERLACLKPRADVGIPSPHPDRDRRWRHLSADNDPSAFTHRLEWDDIPEASAHAALANSPPEDVFPCLPEATSGLIEAIRTAARQQAGSDMQDITGAIVPADPLPFEALVLPAVTVASDLLCLSARANPAVGAGLALLSPLAVATLKRYLLAQLVGMTATVWLEHFNQQRPAGYHLVFALAPDADPPATRTAYDGFVQRQLADGLGLCDQRPALARLMADLTGQWLRATEVFLARLASDWQGLLDTFGADHPSGSVRVETLIADLSDRHHHGQTVLGVTLTGGVTVAYKPRPVGLEAGLNRFLTWCNDTGELPLDLRILTVLEQDGYGWVEWVESAPVTEPEGITRFFERAGILLGIVHLLWGTDCHRENLIAAGEHPVLIDAEALFHHEASAAMFGQLAPMATSIDRTFRDSVLRTGLLPRWDLTGDATHGRDVSALGGNGVGMESVIQWARVNTDYMHRRPQQDVETTDTHWPRLPDGGSPKEADVAAIEAGFAACYRMAMRHPETVRHDGPLAVFAGCPARFVLRPTQVYQQLMSTSWEPAHLTDAVDRSLCFEPLYRALVTAPICPPAWPLVAAEAAAQERGDVPYFWGRTTDTTLHGEGVTIPGFFEQPSLEQAKIRWQELSEADLDVQLALIRGAFHARQARQPGAERLSLPTEPMTDLPTVTPAALEAAAIAIARELANRALKATNGSISWIGLARHSASERYQLQPLGTDLYSGSTGVALFLAAVDHLAPTEGFAALARGALQTLLDALDTDNPPLIGRWVKDQGIGGCLGLGSIVYGLTRIADSLADPSLLGHARRAAALITPSVIEADGTLDLLGGSAGAILGLLALHGRTGDPSLLATARYCADHLLAKRIPTDTGHRAWKSIATEPLTGFAHGAAGIAYALLRLHEVVPETPYRQAAEEALAFERTICQPGKAPLPNASGPGPVNPWFMLNWCHGATGIGLGRLGISGDLDAESAEDVSAAIEAVERWGMQEIDHLCCGNAGRIDLLIEGSTRLDRPDLLDMARRRAGWVLRRAEQTGGYRLFPTFAEQVFSPGMFQGYAGIGYHWMRLANPGLPSVLLLH